MNKTVLLVSVGLLMAAVVIPAAPAAACGWQFTCDTDTWAKEELQETRECLREGEIEPHCAPDLH